MTKVTKLSQLDPGIVELIKSDNDQDLILANNFMKVLGIRLSGHILKELNPILELEDKMLRGIVRHVIAGKYVYDLRNNDIGLERRDNWDYIGYISRPEFNYKEEIDNYLKNEKIK